MLSRRTFAERLPELIRPHARRTGRLAEAQARVGAALGGEGSARLLQHLAMPASADTVLRLIRNLPLPEPELEPESEPESEPVSWAATRPLRAMAPKRAMERMETCIVLWSKRTTNL